MWFDLALWYIKHCRVFNVKYSLYIYNKYDLWTHFVDNILKWTWALLCTTLNGFKLQHKSHNLTSIICWTQSGTTTLGQSRLGINGNEGVLHIPKISKPGASLCIDIISRTLVYGSGVLPLCRDAVGELYNPGRFG